MLQNGTNLYLRARLGWSACCWRVSGAQLSSGVLPGLLGVTTSAPSLSLTPAERIWSLGLLSVCLSGKSSARRAATESQPSMEDTIQASRRGRPQDDHRTRVSTGSAECPNRVEDASAAEI